MSSRQRRKLGRGMSQLVEGSLRSIVQSTSPIAPPPLPATPQARPSQPAASPAAHTAPAPPIAAPPKAGPPKAAPPKAGPPKAGTHRRDTAFPGDGRVRPVHVVGISSGKGGTGKSIIASNLAVALAPSLRVTVLDADLGLANIHILYNLLPEYNASHVIAGEKRLDEILLHGPRGVRVIPGGSGIPELATLSDMMFGSLADGIASLEGSTDLLLIDAPSGLDRQGLTFLLSCDQLLVVTTEDVTAMTDAYAVVKTVLTRQPGAMVAIVVNQARSYAEGMETFQRIAHVARKFLGHELALGGIVPFDERVERSVADREPVSIGHPESPAARALASLAGRVSTFRQRVGPAPTPFNARLKGLLRSMPARA